jgi:Helix-turn-helix
MEVAASRELESYPSSTAVGSGGRCLWLWPATSLDDTWQSYLTSLAPAPCKRKSAWVKAVQAHIGDTAYAFSPVAGSSSSPCPVISCAPVWSRRNAFNFSDAQNPYVSAWLYGTNEPVLLWRQINPLDAAACTYFTLVLHVAPDADLTVTAPLLITANTEGSNSLFKRTVENVEAQFGITRSQLAQALLVERATLYQWFRGAQPRPKTAERLSALQSVARAWRQANLGPARTMWHLRMRGSDQSLGELLSSEPLQVNALNKLIQDTASQPESEIPSPSSELEGFPSQNALEERRRRRRTYPPTFPSES